MRILKILNSNDDGGVLTCEVQFIRQFQRQGVIVDAIILGKGNSFDRYADIVNVVVESPVLDTKFSGGFFNTVKNIWMSYLFGKNKSKIITGNLAKKKYDALIYRRANLLFFAGIVGKKLGIRNVYWHMPNIVSGTFSYLFYNLFLRIFHIKPVANSMFTKNTIGKLCKSVIYPGFDPDRIKIDKINNGNNIRSRLGIPEDVGVYGVLARVTPDKAQDIVTEAFIKSKIINDGGCLVIAGGLNDHKYVDKIKEIAGEYLNKNIFLIGQINEVGDFYNAVDVIVNGRRNAEPFGISIAESLGCGKPILAYYLGGPSEMIIDGKGGWLVYEPTVDKFTTAFNRSYMDRLSWELMGVNNKNISSKFSVETNVQNFIDLINTHN